MKEKPGDYRYAAAIQDGSVHRPSERERKPVGLVSRIRNLRVQARLAELIFHATMRLIAAEETARRNASFWREQLIHDARTARKPENRSTATPEGFDNPQKKRAGNSRSFQRAQVLTEGCFPNPS